LCLFAPRNVEDDKLLGELFDTRGILGARLGRNIAFCLFSSEATLKTVVEPRGASSASYLFIPGLVGTYNLKVESIEPAVAATVPDSVRREVQLRSAAIVNEFVEYFDLEVNDLPCLIFVFKHDRRPFVLSTHGGASVSSVVGFFDALAEIARQVESSGALALPTWVAVRRHAIADVEDLRELLRVKTSEASRELAAAAEAAKAYGLAQTILDVGPEQANDLYRFLGIQEKKDKHVLFVPESTRSAARAAMLDEHAANRIRRAARSGVQRRRVEERLHRREADLRAIERELVLDSVSAGVETVEQSVEDLCAKYERKFKRARNFMTIKKFVRVITGTAKAAENLTTSIGKTVDQLAKSLDE
jgi:hypothetical protein